MSERSTVKGSFVVIVLIALGVIAGVAEGASRHVRDGREPTTMPGATTQAGGDPKG
jgi:hypothetical protein